MKRIIIFLCFSLFVCHSYSQKVIHLKCNDTDVSASISNDGSFGTTNFMWEGSVKNSQRTISGKIENAIQRTGSKYFKGPIDSTFSTAQGTLCFWYRPQDLINGAICGVGETSQNGYYFSIESDGQIDATRTGIDS